MADLTTVFGVLQDLHNTSAGLATVVVLQYLHNTSTEVVTVVVLLYLQNSSTDAITVVVILQCLYNTLTYLATMAVVL